ncbi:MAG: FecR domain-containing protein [Saprospiraceae bacterium]
MKEEQNLNNIAKYLSDNSDSKDREALFAWVKEDPANKTLLEDSMEVWEASEPTELEFQPNIDAAWNKMDGRLQTARATSNSEAIIRPIAFFKPWMRIAAAAVILLGTALWQYPSFSSGEMIERQTIAQEKTTIDLPDGSKVWLNQNSSLQFEKTFDKRIVYLEGEAFFDVAKKNGQSFEIFAGDSKTKVLGTSFNVRAYPDENKVEITVETGKVDFSAENDAKENVLLTKGDFATYTKTSQEVQKLALTKLNAAAWKKGALQFDDTNLEEVVESLERYYNIEIKVTNNKIFNCILSITQTHDKPVLEELFELLEYTNDLKIEQTADATFSVSGKGCE